MITSVSKHDIEITEESDWDEVAKHFLKTISNDYNTFKKNYQKEKENFNKLKIENSKNIALNPESLYVKSPLTIFNGKWGIGKTKFLENIGLVMHKNKDIDGNVFKNFININLWNYSDPKYSPMDLIAEIIFKLNEVIYSKDEVLGKSILSIGEKIMNSIFIPLVNNTFGIEAQKLFEKSKNEQEQFEELNDILRTKLKPTLVILDNIERLGPMSIQVFKGIHRLLQLENMVFVLPVNIEEFEINSSNNITESFIEKYINISYYSFTQNIQSLLNNQLKNTLQNETIDLINIVLNDQNNGRILSIRNVKNLFNNHYDELITNGFAKNDFIGLFKLNKYWPIKEERIKTLQENVINHINDTIVGIENKINDLIEKIRNVNLVINRNNKYNFKFNDNGENFRLIEYDKKIDELFEGVYSWYIDEFVNNNFDYEIFIIQNDSTFLHEIDNKIKDFIKSLNFLKKLISNIDKLAQEQEKDNNKKIDKANKKIASKNLEIQKLTQEDEVKNSDDIYELRKQIDQLQTIISETDENNRFLESRILSRISPKYSLINESLSDFNEITRQIELLQKEIETYSNQFDNNQIFILKIMREKNIYINGMFELKIDDILD